MTTSTHGNGLRAAALLAVALGIGAADAQGGWTITNPSTGDTYRENYDVLCYGGAPENGSCVVEFQLNEPTLEKWVTVAGPDMVSAENVDSTWSWNHTLRTAEAGEYRLELQPYPRRYAHLRELRGRR